MWSRVLLYLTVIIQFSKWRENGKTHNIQCNVLTLFLTTRYKNTPSIDIFSGKTTYIDNHYDLYIITCADVSFMLEAVGFTVSYALVAVIHSLHIIICIEYVEG